MSYSGDPTASVIDEVRFLIGDTSNDPGTERLTDDEISYAIGRLSDTWDDALMYAAYCADVLAAFYAGEVSISADGVSISSEQLQTKYQAMGQRLREQYRLLHGAGAEVYAGGVLEGDRAWGTKPLNFGVGMGDNPRAGRQYDNNLEWWEDDAWH